MRKTTLSLVIGTLVASGAACAGNEGEEYGSEATFGTESELSVESVEEVGASSAFAQLDADGNGKVSEEEASAMEGLEAKLASLDSNGDGALSFDEFAALAATGKSDSDIGWSGQSSSLSATETDTGVITPTDSADVDSGIELGTDVESEATLAGTEVEAETDAGLAVGTETDAGMSGMESGMESEGAIALKVEAITETNVEQTFETVDANGDDAVDSTEATSITGLPNVFAQLDANADGELDYTEFQAVTSLNTEYGAEQG